jgi:hypothetical protein
MQNPDSSWRGPAARVVAPPTQTNQQIRDSDGGGGVGSEDIEGVGSHDSDGVRAVTWY